VSHERRRAAMVRVPRTIFFLKFIATNKNSIISPQTISFWLQISDLKALKKASFHLNKTKISFKLK
jgi:hypothetical protein